MPSEGCGAGVPDWLGALFEGLDDDPEQQALVAASVAAAAALSVGWARPAPWLLALLLVAILAALWLFTVTRFMATDDWEREGAAGSGAD